MGILVTSCGGDDAKEKEIAVSGVSVSPTTLSLSEGGKARLGASVTPSDANDKTVSWTSSDESVASVGPNGKVTGVKAGSAIITVTTKDGGKKAICTVTVAAKIVAVESVSLDKTTLSLQEGSSGSLTATVKPDNATDKSVEWSSSDATIASVDQDGKVGAKKAGSAIITVTTKDGGKKAECAVSVLAQVATAVFIRNLYWATGNLVADGANGAKIGSPTDGGLYFQWGSLLGWKGGATGDGTGLPLESSAGVMAISPKGYSGSSAWNGKWTGDVATDDAATGKGDPCRYYLGGKWRLPTESELRNSLAGKISNDKWEEYPDWKWQASPAGAKYTNGETTLFIPTSGWLRYNLGNLEGVGNQAYFWSSGTWEDKTNGYCTVITEESVTWETGSILPSGMPVRCVHE